MSLVWKNFSNKSYGRSYSWHFQSLPIFHKNASLAREISYIIFLYLQLIDFSYSSTILFYQYAKFQNWPDLVQATLFGIVLGTIYLLVYYYYLWDKVSTHDQGSTKTYNYVLHLIKLQLQTKFNDSVVKWGWFVALVLVYANWQSSASQYFEYILAGLNYSSLIYPFMGVVRSPSALLPIYILFVYNKSNSVLLSEIRLPSQMHIWNPLSYNIRRASSLHILASVRH